MTKILAFFFAIAFALLSFGQGAVQWEEDIDLKNKRVGLVCNHTSLVGKEHRIDYLLRQGCDLRVVFTPEHGLSGLHDAGAKVSDSTIREGRILVRSLYGNNKKPKAEWLEGLDVVLFDIQDVGCRFYTYISTLEYVMQTCIEVGVPMIVYDRPNPNNFVDGPVLEPKYRSFVGMQSIPVCYGLTIGEYAMMINGEHWVDSGRLCDLKVVKMLGYNRLERNALQVAPSPNLKTLQAIKNYPTLCFFEGTPYEVGRGTPTPFEVVFNTKKDKGEIFRFDSIRIETQGIDLEFLIQAYNESGAKEKFFNNFFDKLAGTDKLRRQIIEGKSPEQIRLSWQGDIDNYLKIREKYLIY